MKELSYFDDGSFEVVDWIHGIPNFLPPIIVIKTTDKECIEMIKKCPIYKGYRILLEDTPQRKLNEKTQTTV